MVTISVGVDSHREIIVDNYTRRLFREAIEITYNAFLDDLRDIGRRMVTQYGVTEEEADTEVRQFFADRLTRKIEEKFNE